MTFKFNDRTPIFRKILLVSVKFFVRNSVGPEMGAPILWALGRFVFFLQENLHAHKIPRYRVGILGFGGGESARFYFYGRGDFSVIYKPP